MPNWILDTENKEYREFMQEALNMMEKMEVVGIAIIALTPDNTLTGYWEMELGDMQTAKDQIELDIIDKYLHNVGYVLKEPDICKEEDFGISDEE